ncbi:MAG: hypothetical protein KAU20_01480 [Nanoarchaeota archaeon]|nr:hypothetical protein [Nanoarchaeota archaeon]
MLKKLIKWPHFYYVLFIVILALLLSGPLLNLNNSKRNGDWRNSDTPGYHFLKQYVIEDKSWPLWDHMTFSGRPLFSFGLPLQYPVAIILSLFLHPYATLNLMMILHLLLAGLGMYFLAYEILKCQKSKISEHTKKSKIFCAPETQSVSKDAQKPLEQSTSSNTLQVSDWRFSTNKKSALISSVIYSLCPYLLISSLNHPFWVYGLSYIPLELFLAIKSFKSKLHFIRYSVILGLVFALHFLSGGILQWYYAVGFVSFYLFFKIFGKNWQSRLIKSSLILIIFLALTFSLSAVRFLPGNEWTSFTNRGVGLPMEEIMRVGHLEWNNFIDTFVYSLHHDSKAGRSRCGQIGLVGLGLMVFGIYSYFKNKDYKIRKKDMMLFLIITMVLVSIFASGIFLKYIYNFPGIKSQRGLDRSLIIYVVCAALMAGFGMNYLFEKLKTKNYSLKKMNVIFLIVIVLVAGNLLFIDQESLSNFRSGFEHYSITENNPVFLKIAEDKDIFRFHVIEVAGVDWNNFLGSSIPLNLESIYGMYGPLWDSRYFHTFLASTFRSPAKLWGMLNVKYIISANEINNTDYEFVERFDDVPLDTISKKKYNNTAYLYKNKKFLPRAFISPTPILIVGQEDNVKQLMYGLLINPNFDPSKTIIVQGKETIDSYGINELRRYDAVFLTQGSITQNSQFILESYKNKGGAIFPDVLDGKNMLSNEEIDELFLKLNKVNKTMKKIKIISYYDKTPNFMRISLDNKENSFLFVSEKYTLYPGWTAKIDGKETEILLSNGVLSAVYIPIDSEYITFKYYPRSFRKGLIITILSSIIILFYFGYKTIKYLKKKKQIIS